jgi:hypothetical protein
MRVLAAISFTVPFVALLLGAAACGDDETSPPAATPDASQPDVGSTPADTGTPIDDGGLTVDAQPDTADAAPPMVVYSIIAQKLVTLDPVTGAIVEVGPLGQTFAPLVWDTKANVARIITTATTAPTLGTVNLCTGAITAGPRMTVGGNDLDMAEGFTQDPVTGTFYATVDLDNSSTTLTEATATVDVGTGAITTIGTHTTLQNDGDVLAWIGTQLHLLDVATTVSKSAYYTIDTTTGAATLVKEVTALPQLPFRFAEDKSRGKVFATYGTEDATTRGFASIDLVSGTMTPIGPVLATTTYSGQNFQTLMVAPKPTCP